MADVKWIRICTDMINNKKIKRIRTMPEGNNIVLIWVFLIAQAGESNRGGGLFLTDTIPFTHEDLAVEFGFEIPVIQLALITLEKFSMIEVYDDVIYIKNWEEYQNSDGLEKIREQGRERAKKFREKKKQELLTADSNAKDNVTVTLRNATEEELELELERELNIHTNCDCEKIKDMFNSIAVDLPKVKALSEARKKAINARVKEYGIDLVHEAFINAQESEFLSGRGGDKWKASFDWIMNPNNFIKVIEGNYSNNGKCEKETKGSGFIKGAANILKNNGGIQDEQKRNCFDVDENQRLLPGFTEWNE